MDYDLPFTEITKKENPELTKIRNFTGAYPKQLWGLAFTEVWERLCFYGMRGMLTYFMVNHLLMDEKTANLQYGATQAFVYAFTFIGGIFADKILGFKKSLFWGALLMIAGSILLAIDPKEFFFLGIAFNIIGTGFFKPNISSMVGLLYNDNDTRKDAGYLLFYSGINIGAFVGGYIISLGKGTMFTSIIPEALRWNVAFGVAAVAMSIALLVFLATKKELGPIGESPLKDMPANKAKMYEYAVYIGAIVAIPLILKMVSNTTYTDYFMYAVGPFSLLYLFYQMTTCTAAENKKLIAALLFIIFSIVFWAIFEQAGGSLSLFAANNLDNKLLGFITTDPNGFNNSVNALFVIFLAAPVGLLFIAMAKRKIEPNTVVKFGIGFLFLGAGFLIFYALRFYADAQGVSSLNVFGSAYLVVTFAELFLSPIGLSIMSKLAPFKLQGLMMGMWFLASAYGQYVAGIFGASISPAANSTNPEKLLIYTQGYKDFAWYAIIAGVILITISPLIRKLMQEVK
jgi:proton-dependent oligopeptide transporter, POT family